MCLRAYILGATINRPTLDSHPPARNPRVESTSVRSCGIPTNTICASPKATVVNAGDGGSGLEETRVRRYAMALLAQCVRYVHCRTKPAFIKWLFFGKL